MTETLESCKVTVSVDILQVFIEGLCVPGNGDIVVHKKVSALMEPIKHRNK